MLQKNNRAYSRNYTPFIANELTNGDAVIIVFSYQLL